jgi:hypothetical protein
LDQSALHLHPRLCNALPQRTWTRFATGQNFAIGAGDGNARAGATTIDRQKVPDHYIPCCTWRDITLPLKYQNALIWQIWYYFGFYFTPIQAISHPPRVAIAAAPLESTENGLIISTRWS